MENFEEFEYEKNRSAKADLIKKNIAGTIDAIIVIMLYCILLLSKYYTICNNMTDNYKILYIFAIFIIYRLITIITIKRTIGMILIGIEFSKKDGTRLNLKEKLLATMMVYENNVEYYNTVPKFLTIKHWQFFGLLIGLLIVLLFFIYIDTFVSSYDTTMFYFFPLMMLLINVLYFGWLYVLGTNLHKKLPQTEKMNIVRFKIFLLIPVIYFLLQIYDFMAMWFTKPSLDEPNHLIIALIFSLKLFSTFCVFFCLYFNAKALKAVECQKKVSFSDFTAEFFLFCLFPIGIWIIQPRINKLFDRLNGIDNNQIFDKNL
ncbi:hypothetical protein RIU21_10110 [Riemerella anatipestifer]|uniref:hypothetical protein n=1 Tax=Riemerella anatipestifer TaxID=34085 RepID=UPI00285465F7|nr:hypothetical protein [Riemerella anatipestifer]MDR7847119.1 hypothetical protein [Riemerella anatipestifer]